MMADYNEFIKKLKKQFGTTDNYALGSNSEIDKIFNLAAARRKDRKGKTFDVRGIAGQKEISRPSNISGLPLKMQPSHTPGAPVTNVDSTGNVATSPIIAAPYGKVPEKSKIDPVTDRYAKAYTESQAALNAYNKESFKGGVGGNANSASLAKFNSPKRSALIRSNKQAFRLLQGGSFADKANIQNEARVNQLAQAQSALSQIPYRESTAKSASLVASAQAAAARKLLGQGKSKKKKLNFDQLASFLAT